MTVDLDSILSRIGFRRFHDRYHNLVQNLIPIHNKTVMNGMAAIILQTMAAILRPVNAVTDRNCFASADADDSDAGIGKRRCNRCNRLGLFHFFLIFST